LVLITYTIATLAATGRGLGTLSLYYIYLQTFPQISSQFGAMPMLGHTWTLAIEEQFYFLWPLVVFLVRGRKLVLVMIVMMAVALGLRFASLGWANPFLIDGWLGVQVDALAAGAMVAYASLVWDPETLKRWSVRAFVVGTGALLALIASAGVKVFWTPLSWGRMWWGPLLISILACAFAGAVGMAATEHPWTRWLTFRPLRRWGKISYGIYLYHPFTYLAIEIAIGRFGHPQGRAATAAIALAKLLLTYLAAWLSWTWIEAPLNHLKERFTRY
jgi:peptidoglycan/LPS O-acetylase OafA/YrhL